jgi:hypothetical protein
MTTYTPTGDFDPEAAAAAVRAAAGITHREAKRDALLAIQTAALVDIAASLSVLAVESAWAMQPARVELGMLDDDDDESAPEPVDLTEADAGTRVRLITPGADAREGELTGSGGIDQGIPWVGVAWDDDVLTESRVFVPHLEAVHAPTLPVLPEVREAAAEAGAPVAELDADFDGDEHPQADAAVEALARQRKAAKAAKLGKKSGK